MCSITCIFPYSHRICETLTNRKGTFAGNSSPPCSLAGTLIPTDQLLSLWTEEGVFLLLNNKPHFPHGIHYVLTIVVFCIVHVVQVPFVIQPGDTGRCSCRRSAAGHKAGNQSDCRQNNHKIPILCHNIPDIHLYPLFLRHNDWLIKPRLLRELPGHLTAAARVKKPRHFFSAGRPVLALELAGLQSPFVLNNVLRQFIIVSLPFPGLKRDALPNVIKLKWQK